MCLKDEAAGQYCIHAMNAAYLKQYHQWLRIDVRGNKAGADAQFTPPEERIAFTTNPDAGEIDYPTIYVQPNLETMQTLQRAQDAIAMYLHQLPEHLA